MKQPLSCGPKDKNRSNRGSLLFTLATSLLCIPLAIATFGKAPSPKGAAQNEAPAKSAGESERTKLAEGEYAIYEQGNGGAVGAAGEEVYDFRESWTLWRVGGGQFEADGERTFESPHGTKHTDRFLIRLSRDMTPLRMTEYAKLAWRRDSGPTTCEFAPREIHCYSGPQTAPRPLELRIPMQHPYGFLWPISPFSLSGLAKQSERDLNHPNAIQLLSIEQPSPANPVYPVVRTGELQYLGEQNMFLADEHWTAHKFSLKVPSYPQFLVWTSSNGILLSVAMEHDHPNWPEEGMKLSRYRKFADF